MSNRNDKTAFQLGADAISKIAHPRKHSQAVDNRLSGEQSFISELMSKIKRASVFADETTAKELDSLLEDIRFSDPVSVEESLEDERHLISMADGFLAAIEKDENVTTGSIDRARKLLSARNAICKQSK